MSMFRKEFNSFGKSTDVFNRLLFYFKNVDKSSDYHFDYHYKEYNPGEFIEDFDYSGKINFSFLKDAGINLSMKRIANEISADWYYYGAGCRSVMDENDKIITGILNKIIEESDTVFFE